MGLPRLRRYQFQTKRLQIFHLCERFVLHERHNHNISINTKQYLQQIKCGVSTRIH